MLSDKLQAKTDALATTEYADGAITVEYVIIIMFVVGLGAALIAFRTQISTFLTNAQTAVGNLLTNLGSTSGGKQS